MSISGMSLKRVKNESKAQSNETARGPEPEKTYSIFFLHPEVNQMEIFFFFSQYQAIHILGMKDLLWDGRSLFFFNCKNQTK